MDNKDLNNASELSLAMAQGSITYLELDNNEKVIVSDYINTLNKLSCRSNQD